MTTESDQDDFRILADFLDAFGTAAQGHARSELKDEEKARLDRLVRGDLEDEERRELVPLLMHNEVAMEFVAEKALGQ